MRARTNWLWTRVIGSGTRIGRDVLIGAGAVIFDCTIGDGAADRRRSGRDQGRRPAIRSSPACRRRWSMSAVDGSAGQASAMVQTATPPDVGGWPQ